MSSDSDSDDDIQMKQFLEAADTTLLNNSMFQKNGENICELGKTAVNQAEAIQVIKNDKHKSQRYIEDESENKGTDFNLPESMQNFLAKKLTELLKQQYEFHDISMNFKPGKDEKKYKNRVKLLKGDDCYVKPYEEFNYDIKGPDKKPVIKRRILETPTDNNCTKEDQYKSVAVDGDYILSGAEVKMWAKKKERKDKVFNYKMSSHGVLHEREAINEFTELRRKNKWNENKIKAFKK